MHRGGILCESRRTYRVGVEAFHLAELIAELDSSRHDAAEFFRAETLSLTVAYWPAGSVDTQQPHTEDEVYYIAAGRAQLQVAGEDREVGPGTIVYVAAAVEHHFHSIEEGLKVVVFWSPPRHANAPG